MITGRAARKYQFQMQEDFFKAEKRSDASNEIVCLPCQLEKLAMILELALYVESSLVNRLKLNTNLTLKLKNLI